MGTIEIGQGFTEDERALVAELYWGAFGRKLSPAFADAATGLSVVRDRLRSDRMLVARREGQVVGVCGFHADGVGTIDLTWAVLRERFSTLSALRAAVVLSILQRKDSAGTMTLDGICVDPALRSNGVGSQLLDAIGSLARERKLSRIQLSVIDSNPRAAALYRRHGFRASHHTRMGPLRHVFGFAGVTTMHKSLTA